ncbi:hypothetical protein [Persicobacter diffluens]|uniref:Uncharacterized protein n=1 Tax=Persicobacter diffluens TaxID=981 RepID=A0AAN4VVH7_9BACT|nr:hypothetical protein PEDI_02400 [Persicobacter diffluens]
MLLNICKYIWKGNSSPAHQYSLLLMVFGLMLFCQQGQAQNRPPSASDAIMYQSGSNKNAKDSNYKKRRERQRSNASKNTEAGLKKTKKSKELESKYLSKKQAKYKGRQKRKNEKAVYRKKSKKQRKGGGGVSESQPQRFNEQSPKPGRNMASQQEVVPERFKERPSNFDKYRGGKDRGVAYDGGGGITGRRRASELKRQGMSSSKGKSSDRLERKYLSQRQSRSTGDPASKSKYASRKSVYKKSSREQMNNRGEYKLTAERFKSYPNAEKFNPDKMKKINPTKERNDMRAKSMEGLAQGIYKRDPKGAKERYESKTRHQYSGDIRNGGQKRYARMVDKSIEAQRQGSVKGSASSTHQGRRVRASQFSRYTGDQRHLSYGQMEERRKSTSDRMMKQGLRIGQPMDSRRLESEFITRAQQEGKIMKGGKSRQQRQAEMQHKSMEMAGQGLRKVNPRYGEPKDKYLSKTVQNYQGSIRRQSKYDLYKQKSYEGLNEGMYVVDTHKEKQMRFKTMSKMMHQYGGDVVRKNKMSLYQDKSSEALAQGQYVVDTHKEKQMRYKAQSKYMHGYEGTMIRKNKVALYQDKSEEALGQGQYVVDTHKEKRMRYKAQSKYMHGYQGTIIQKNKVALYQDKSAEAQRQGQYVVDTRKMRQKHFKEMSQVAHNFSGTQVYSNKVTLYQDKSAEMQKQGLYMIDTKKMDNRHYKWMSKNAHQYEGSFVDHSRVIRKLKAKEAYRYSGEIPAKQYYQRERKRQVLASRMMRYEGTPHKEVGKLGMWWKGIWYNDTEMKAVKEKQKKPSYNAKEYEIWDTGSQFQSQREAMTIE